jgi:hypothetical protein
MSRIGKNLAGLLKKSAIISGFIVPLFFSGCREENYPPEAKQEVSPLSGDAPLNVRIKETGDDLNGIEDIKLYELYVNDKLVKSKSTPIDTTITFSEPGTVKIYGKVIDSENQSDNTETVSVQVSQGPFLEQSVSLENYVNLKYSATLSKVPKAQLKVKREGVLISTEEISDVNPTGVDFEKTYGTAKGNYEFTLTSNNLEKKNSTEIPNYKPTGNFTNLNLEVEQSYEKNVTLTPAEDKNPEDNPVAFQSAKSLDGKTQLTLNGNNLNIKALSNYTGDYQFELEYGSTVGGLEKSVLGGKITAHSWKYLVNPFVQPNDTTKPIIWNNFSTTGQRTSHYYNRLYNYDFTNKMTYIPGNFVCTDFASLLATNFNGYGGLGFDPAKGLEHNGEQNIPMYTIYLSVSGGGPLHTIDGVVVGDNFADVNSWIFTESESDSTYSPSRLKELGAYEMQINYTYVKENEVQGKFLSSVPMLKFILDENGEWKDSGYRHPDIKLIEERQK